jgi:hypothetical protein
MYSGKIAVPPGGGGIVCKKKKSSMLSDSIQGVPGLAPQRKQACADNKRDSKLTKINFLLAQITEL